MNLPKTLLLTSLASLLPFYLTAAPFIATWKTDNPGTSCNSCITIPTIGGGYSYDVDWDNDGTFDEFGLTGNVTHDFGIPGTYTIRIQGDFPRIYFFNSGEGKKILSIDQWGDIVWTSMQLAFFGASNLTYNATDAPDLSNVTSLNDMFTLASLFNGDLSGWDVSNVTDMSAMFNFAFSFNGDISTWDVSNVTNMSFMFNSANSFNMDISSWDVSNVTNMIFMFSFADSFNGDISAWDVSNVTNMRQMFTGADSFNGDISSWDVSNVTDMSFMFNSTSSFNGDISAWDVSNVTNMRQMFHFATSFNRDISAWDVSNVTNMNDMFDFSGMDVFNYDQTLIGWAAQAVQTGVELGARELVYCLGEDARNTLINTYSWDITEDTKNCAAYNDPPIAMCQNLTMEADVNCQGEAEAEDFDNGSSDPNSDELSFSVEPAGPYPIGTTNVVLTVEDTFGATSQCTATITVEETTPPNPVCLHPTIEFNGEALIPLSESDVWDAVASTDNCGDVLFVSMSPDEVDCSQIGSVIPLTVTVEDSNGNPNTCIANVTVSGLPCGFSAPPGGINCTDGSQADYDPDTETFSLTAEGCYDPNYYSNSDSHAYLGSQLCGDGEIMAQVTGVTGNGYAGITMREDLSAGSKMLQLGIDGVNLSKRELRVSTGALAYNHLFQTQGHNWLKLTRIGNNFTAQHSLDGVNWSTVISTTITMNSCIEIGLYAENNTAGGNMTATFENVEINTITTLSAPHVSSIDIASNREPVLSVYPNPAKEEAWIELENSRSKKTSIRLFNHLGQLIFEVPNGVLGEQRIRLNLADWLPGIYLVQVKTEGQPVMSKKLIVLD